mmetsp:Transcript_28945/g.56818  ORF Transcript_28945/g.56818 Transcript_28945/m.56818 type:complete len:429 (+) Transcript_28945:56-1342(+)|eukprot:CAMPEP_0175145148 /NCGR_PEP_ID=MMETSP0087-20121206/14586_1 /TAXON_ID=136419 /ORGANISM="Unknown Unknown, Strain D1" /LENGTH=428 /DNA_ID=CAMNT_0016429815 /DNA_START=51 /DNA_END=1337 /DNA_ORIENTATION=-
MVHNEQAAKAQLHNFSFYLAGFLLLVWLLRAIFRARALQKLWQAVKLDRVVRYDGVNVTSITTEQLRTLMLNRVKHSKTQMRKIEMRSHVDKDTAKLAQKGNTVWLTLSVEATAHTKIEVYIGVLHSAMQQQFNDRSQGAKKKKSETDVQEEVTEKSKLKSAAKGTHVASSSFSPGDYLFKTEPLVLPFGASGKDIKIPLEARWFTQLLGSPDFLPNPVVVVVTPVVSPKGLAVCSNSEKKKVPSPRTQPVYIPGATEPAPLNANAPAEVTIAPYLPNKGADSRQRSSRKKGGARRRKPDQRDQQGQGAGAGGARQRAEAGGGGADAAAQPSSFVESIKFEKQLVVSGGGVHEMQSLFGMEDDTHECIVCFTDPRDVILLPCRHICVCSGCFANLQSKCPSCREPIISHMKFIDPARLRKSKPKTVSA